MSKEGLRQHLLQCHAEYYYFGEKLNNGSPAFKFVKADTASIRDLIHYHDAWHTFNQMNWANHE